VAYGVPYLANPDLVERFRRNATLNAPDMDTFYGGNEKGYTDYPFLD
jgi:N-ethylmaleimide reductase